MAEQTGNVVELPKMDNEPVEVYLDMLGNFRQSNIEVLGNIKGVSFSNMAGQSTEEAYIGAVNLHGYENIEEKQRLERDEKLTKIGYYAMRQFAGKLMTGEKISTGNIIDFFDTLATLAKETTDRVLKLDKTIGGLTCDELANIGYQPVPKGQTFSHNKDEMTGTISVDFVGRTICDYTAYMPVSALGYLQGSAEDFATYVIENGMAQLKEGKLDYIVGNFCGRYRGMREEEEKEREESEKQQQTP